MTCAVETLSAVTVFRCVLHGTDRQGAIRVEQMVNRGQGPNNADLLGGINHDAAAGDLKAIAFLGQVRIGLQCDFKPVFRSRTASAL